MCASQVRGGVWVCECVPHLPSFPVPYRASFPATAVVLTVTMRTRKVGTPCLGETRRWWEVKWALEHLRAQARDLSPGMSLFLTLGLRLEGKRFLELGKEEDFHPELEGRGTGKVTCSLQSTCD